MSESELFGKNIARIVNSVGKVDLYVYTDSEFIGEFVLSESLTAIVKNYPYQIRGKHLDEPFLDSLGLKLANPERFDAIFFKYAKGDKVDCEGEEKRKMVMLTVVKK